MKKRDLDNTKKKDRTFMQKVMTIDKFKKNEEGKQRT